MKLHNYALALLLPLLNACVSEHTELRNDRGQVLQCNADGWGWLGAPVAAASHSKCVKQAHAAGFHSAGIAETATPPPQPSSTPVPAPASAAPIAPAAVAATPSAPPAPGQAADRLKKLDDLYKAGLLTQAEYDKKRQEVLATL